MGGSDIRMICEAILDALDSALTGFSWADNPDAYESLQSVEKLTIRLRDSVDPDDVAELDFY